MRILVTNDDGYFAEGIKALVEELYKTALISEKMYKLLTSKVL